MDIEHVLQFDVPDGVSTICIGDKIYTKEELEKLKSKKLINFEEKFGKFICNTSIAICKEPK